MLSSLKTTILPSQIIILLIFVNVYSVNYEVGPDKTYSSIHILTNILRGGDTVFVDGDATYAGGILFTEAGEKDLPIVIKGIRINNRRPIISGGTNSVHFMTDWPYVKGADNYIFEGFEITGGTSRGIFHQADNLTVRDVVVHDCPAQGILGADQGSGSCYLYNVEVYNCGEGSGRHQIYMATDEVNHPGSVFRMEHCYIHDGNGGNNIKSRAERNEIYYNWIESAYYHELELIGPDPWGAADGWTPDLKREDSDIVGNVFWKAGSNKDFSVVRFGGDATGESHGRYRFVNNTVISGTGAVFRCFDSLESIEMHNNVFYPNDNNVINLIRTVEVEWTSGSEKISGLNNWIHEDATNIPTQWTGSILGNNPGFVDFNNYDVIPDSGSELINSGSDTTYSVSGYDFPSPQAKPECHPPQKTISTSSLVRNIEDGIDIGAYESGNSVSLFNNKLEKSFIKEITLSLINNQTLRIKLVKSCYFSMSVYRIDGREVYTSSEKWFGEGIHYVSLNGLDRKNRDLSSGIYLVSLKQNYHYKSFRIVLKN